MVGTVMKTRMSAGIAVQATSSRMSEVTVDGSPGSPTRVENQKIARNITTSTSTMMRKSIQLTKTYIAWIRRANADPSLSVSIGYFADEQPARPAASAASTPISEALRVKNQTGGFISATLRSAPLQP